MVLDNSGWLVDDVFKEEVDQFIIESGMQTMNIKQQGTGPDKKWQSTSATQQRTSTSLSSSLSQSTLSLILLL